MLRLDNTQLRISEHISLYDKLISTDHILRKIKENVDFSFVNVLLKDSYCEYYGRPGKEPEVMFKLIFLKYMHDLSDREVIERAKVDMSYKFFLNLYPEDEIPVASLLSIFRTTKICSEDILEEMLVETIQQAIEKGIIKSNSILVDSTHTKSKGMKQTPTQILREASKNLRKELYRIEPEIKDKMPEKPEPTATIEEEIEYTKELVKMVEETSKKVSEKQVNKRLNKVKALLNEDRIKELQSAIDKDAKQGYKSEDNDFFGYKNHIAITEERFVTAIEVTSGEAPDGKFLQTLVEKSKKAGIDVKEVIGDMAYSGKENLEYGEQENIKVISKMNSIISNSIKVDDGFEYIKDADMMRCPAGHISYYKVFQKERINKKGKYKNPYMRYFFDIEECKKCPHRDKCMKKNSKQKTYVVTLLSDTHQKQKDFQETEYFTTRIKERYKIEGKNAELKKSNGLDIADYLGLSKMRIQSYFTGIVSNIKRMIRIMDMQMAK